MKSDTRVVVFCYLFFDDLVSVAVVGSLVSYYLTGGGRYG